MNISKNIESKTIIPPLIQKSEKADGLENSINNESAENVVEIRNLFVSFGKKNKVLKGLNLHLEKGESLVVLGKSGSGKSVAIKSLVGLVRPDKGVLDVFGKDVCKLDLDGLNKIRLRIGFLFQNGALYDSMTVRENLAFTFLRHTKRNYSKEIDEKILATLESVGLEKAIDKFPSELSGGMKKRAGLARILILKPELMLYDEPTTGLDPITSREISELIKSIQAKYNTSSIIITHDLACAKSTANRVVILKDGIIGAEGTYEELEQCEDEWVRSFFE
ncbi:ATP-binding cassette domain-containing protein [Lacihabitans sp. LS3-19]|uniref:ABC transporter ATP-binding protein n=1 Tax=Lacihabitans sp. LS3-19 TaxID=2487335 RepID=UPI0020CEFBEA|nr:ATP-binding cassette domain-containing protein [Lacihabitans sp. LS3-19]MCP9767047.1 ATP-binding cassette domain-containing protein [Lacihabitans sp. LS3-19]